MLQLEHTANISQLTEFRIDSDPLAAAIAPVVPFLRRLVFNIGIWPSYDYFDEILDDVSDLLAQQMAQMQGGAFAGMVGELQYFSENRGLCRNYTPTGWRIMWTRG